MTKKILARRTLSALALGLALALDAHAGGNLLSNAGAETGDLTGWTPGGDAVAHVDTGTFDPGIDPHSGGYDFVGWTSDADSLTQVVSVGSLAAGSQAVVSFWEQGLNQGTPSDDAFISLTYYDSASNVLGTSSTPEVDSHTGAWQNYTGSFAIPTGTTSIGYTMNFVRHAGSDLDGFVDDNSLSISAVPEPSMAALMAIGLLGLGLGLRARK